MKNFTKKLSAIVLCTVFAAMSVPAFEGPIDTGLGKDFDGAKINDITGGYVNGGAGLNNSYDLNFDGNAHVKWDTLNVNSNETLNFNAVNGANGLTILNTVKTGMSNIYGQINANDGISKLIIANPNGMLFDGAKFTTAGDLMLTTKNFSAMQLKDLDKIDFTSGAYDKIVDDENNIIGITIRKNALFNVNGDYTIMAPAIHAEASKINVIGKTLKMVTANGSDYTTAGILPNEISGVTMKAVEVDGNIYIVSPNGAVRFTDGGKVSGDIDVKTAVNSIAFNYVNPDNKTLEVGGNLTAYSKNGEMLFARNVSVGKNLDLKNDGGFVDVGDINVKGNANLKTTGINDVAENYNHFVHVVGNSTVDGDLNIESSQNTHIGGYNYNTKELLDGNLKVGGNLNVNAKDGHIMTTIDTQANKISLKSDKFNVLTDGKATLKANEYEFSSNGYIGGLADETNYPVAHKVIDIMENYQYIPKSVNEPAYLNVDGGKITKLETPSDASAYIASKGNMELTGAKAGKVYLTSYGKDITISGNDVHAKTITVGKETDKLKVEFPSRDYTLKYTNIRDAKEVTVNGNEEVTYELTNGPTGYNTRDPRPADTTYLVGPDKPVTPPVDPPVNPPVTPPSNPDNPPTPDDNENAKILRSFERPEAVDKVQPYTPVAYAADLDEDEINNAVRKNVDGSVTVVRAFPMVN